MAGQNNPLNVLVVDVGGSHVKIRATGEAEERQFDSGPDMSPAQMAEGVRTLAAGWLYEAVAIGYPGVVKNDRPVTEPYNLGRGWVGFDYRRAFDGLPVKMINDAAMQAFGGYNEGKMLFLGLGTGLGSAMVVDGVVLPMELAHLPYRKHSFEHYVGEDGFDRQGKKKWRRRVFDVVERLCAALLPDEVVIGGGNLRLLDELPPRCRAGDNANAFAGGFRLWAGVPPVRTTPPRVVASTGKPTAKRRSAR